MKFVTVTCCACGMKVRKREIDFLRNGPRYFCNRICSAFSKRKWKTEEKRKAEKAAYDQIYREKNLKRIKKLKRLYFQKTYNPELARIERRKKMKTHVEYCRQPEYRKYKKRYDEKYRARRLFGAFADSHRLLVKLEKAVGKRMSAYEIRLSQGTLNKKQTRAKQLQ